MEGDVIPFIIASVILLFFITISVKMQVSTIDGMNEVSAETGQRIGYKAAGTLHLMDTGESFGVIERSVYSNLKQERETGCGAELPGFGPDESLRLNDDMEVCGEVVRPLSTTITLKETGNTKVYNLTVGESSEGFN